MFTLITLTNNTLFIKLSYTTSKNTPNHSRAIIASVVSIFVRPLSPDAIKNTGWNFNLLSFAKVPIFALHKQLVCRLPDCSILHFGRFFICNIHLCNIFQYFLSLYFPIAWSSSTNVAHFILLFFLCHHIVL